MKVKSFQLIIQSKSWYSISVPVKNVNAIIGGKAEFPCDMYPMDDADNVHLVLWYKDIDGKPLYR